MENDLRRDSSCTSSDSLLEEYSAGVALYPERKKNILLRREGVLMIASFVTATALTITFGAMLGFGRPSTLAVGTEINYIVPQCKLGAKG